MQYSPFKNIIDISQRFGQNFNSIEVVNYWLNNSEDKQVEMIKNDYLNFINSKKFKMVNLDQILVAYKLQDQMGAL